MEILGFYLKKRKMRLLKNILNFSSMLLILSFLNVLILANMSSWFKSTYRRSESIVHINANTLKFFFAFFPLFSNKS